MARNRMIKPEFWEDTKIAELSAFGRLFFIALWNFSDDEGYVEYNPKWLKVKCFPYDNIKIDQLLLELERHNRIKIQNDIIFINNFLKHQRIDKPRKSDLSRMFQEPSKNGREASDTKIEVKEKLKEVNIKERKHFFEDSPFYDFTNFKDALLKKSWSDEKIKHYYEAAKDYSRANKVKYHDWIAAICNWDRRNPYKEKEDWYDKAKKEAGL